MYLKFGSRFRLMIIDDDITNLTLLNSLFNDQYEVLPYTSADEALVQIDEQKPGLILSDLYMPGTDGIELCRIIRQNTFLRNLHVILISSCDLQEKKLEAFASGADDYITKPYEPRVLKARVNTLVKRIIQQNEQFNLYKSLVDGLNEKNGQQNGYLSVQANLLDEPIDTVLGMAKLAEYRDSDIGQHLERVQRYTRILADELSENPVYKGYITKRYLDDVSRSSILHDIGKVGIPDSILLKPGKLTGQEFCKMKTHSVLGGDIVCMTEDQLNETAFLPLGREIAYHHHEKWDGSGYPDGQKGENIPLSARIVAVADVYDTLTSKRVYKPAISHSKTKTIIGDSKGIQFDPLIVDAFLAREGKFKEVYLSML